MKGACVRRHRQLIPVNSRGQNRYNLPHTQLTAPVICSHEPAPCTICPKVRATSLYQECPNPTISTGIARLSCMRCGIQRIRCGSAFGRALHSLAAPNIQPATSREDTLEKGLHRAWLLCPESQQALARCDWIYHIIFADTISNIVCI